jgi:ubiquinone/menaquinone biosynthesis C-methylase UbiE
MKAEHEHEHEHHHRHPHGRVFEAVYTASMLFGRGGMARAVVGLAGISSSDVVVDVGCGPGAAVRRAGRAGAARAVGIDPSPKMLRLARWITALWWRSDGISFLDGAAESLPVDSHSATVVWALQSVHHWEDRRRGLKESLRVLEPGGRLILLEGYAEPGAQNRAKHGMTEKQAAELEALLASAGFTDVVRRIIPVGRRSFTAITAAAGSPPPAM